MLNGLQRILIWGIVVITIAGGIMIYGVPWYKESSVQKLAGDAVMEFCVKGSSEALDQNSQKLQEKWESAVQEANLGYPITRLNLAQDPEIVQQKCDEAQKLVAQVDQGDNVDLYNLVKKFQDSNFDEARKQQKKEYTDAEVCLNSLIALKEAEGYFSENGDAQAAKIFAQQGMWPYCTFFAEQAMIKYGPLPTPTE